MSYNPEIYLESVTREIKSYVEANLNTRIYQVVMEFPGSIIDAQKLPMPKTIIHFDVDDIESKPVGLGDGVFADNYNASDSSLQFQYADVHLINFDVGIWASDKSGGTTSRLRARQILSNLFGVFGIKNFREFSDGGDGGIEIKSFMGGRFAIDASANDIRLYRMVNATLVVKVYSRTPLTLADDETAIEEIDQAPRLTILG